MKIQVVDLFSGCGGMSYGFLTAKTKRLRYELVGAVDVDRHANATYERMIGLKPLQQSIEELAALNRPALRRALRISDAPTLIIGCAPCQGFSSHRKKDHRLDDRNRLLDAFALIVEKLLPDYVVMENVPEMLYKKHWQHYEQWRDRLWNARYAITTQIYNMADFGVPQERYRAVSIASRLGAIQAIPGKYRFTRYKTVRSAIGALPSLNAGERDARDPMHITSKHHPETVRLLSLIPKDGGSRKSLPPDIGPRCFDDVDGFRDVYGRLAWDSPSVSITARCRTPSCGRFAHPEQNRGLSVREAALLQGFPKSYFFEGPFDDKFKQVGNAVAPPFARAIAEHLDRTASVTTTRGNRVLIGITEPLEKSFASSIASKKRRR